MKRLNCGKMSQKHQWLLMWIHRADIMPLSPAGPDWEMEESWYTSALPPPLQVNSLTTFISHTKYIFIMHWVKKNVSFYLFSEPFDPPQNVTVANVTASSITLLWHPPSEPNGIIVHYSIYYSQNNTVTEQVTHEWSANLTVLINLFCSSTPSRLNTGH